MIEPIQEQGPRPTERTSKELFSELVDRAEGMNLRLGGNLLKKVELSNKETFYVLPVTKREGYGLSREQGPLFVNTFFSDMTWDGRTPEEIFASAKEGDLGEIIPKTPVAPESLDEWLDGFSDSLESAFKLNHSEKENVRVAESAIEMLDDLSRKLGGETHTAAQDNPPASTGPQSATSSEPTASRMFPPPSALEQE